MTPTIVADEADMTALAGQLRQAADYAATSAAAVHSGLGLADLALSATLDPGGAMAFEVAAAAVLTGPFGLAGIGAELERVGRTLVRAAADYSGADQATESALGLLHVVVDQDPLDRLTDLTAVAAFEARPVIESLTVLLPLDAAPTVRAVGIVADDEPPPRTVSDLMLNLARVNDDRRPGDGNIDIQTLTGTDAAGQPTRQVVVYLPGTDSWNPLDAAHDVNDVLANAAPMNGQRGSYETGVLTALRRAGVTAADEVTLVGHSQGGAVAVNVARDAVQSGEFNVTHVITAGAPIGVAVRTVPSSVAVLAVENRADVVPAADGAANPRRANVTTVTVDRNAHSVAANHDIAQAYRAGEVDASTDPKVRAFVSSEAPTFTLDHASTQRFSITIG